MGMGFNAMSHLVVRLCRREHPRCRALLHTDTWSGLMILQFSRKVQFWVVSATDRSCAFCRGILVSHVGITCVSRKFSTTSWMIQGFSNLLQFGDCRTPELITRQSGPPLSPSKWIYTTTGFHQTHPFYKDTHYYWLHYFAWVHRHCYVTMCNGFVTVFTILFSIRASHIVFTFSYLSGWSLRPTLALWIVLPHGVVFLTLMVVGAACCTGSSSIASRNASFSRGSCLFTSSLM